MSGNGSERRSTVTEGSEEQEVAAMSKEFGAFSLPLGSDPVAKGSEGLVSRADDQLAVIAAKRKWLISDDAFATLPRRMQELANSESRQAVAAAKVLLDMNAQNESSESGESATGNVVIFLPDNGRGQ